jgi:hypothetical protein
MADGEFFTRATWRPGKKFRMRKRVNRYGGCKTAAPAFLEAAKRVGFKPGRPGYRVCSATKRDGRPCGNLALKGLKVCGAHGGFSVLARQGKLQPSGRTAALRATRAAAVEGRSAPAPLDLIRLSIYQQANQRMRMKLVLAWGTPAWAVLMRQVQP